MRTNGAEDKRAGSFDPPRFDTHDLRIMPPPNQGCKWARVDWEAAKSVIDAGRAISFSCSRDDVLNLRSYMNARLGPGLKSRYDVNSARLLVCRKDRHDEWVSRQREGSVEEMTDGDERST